MPKTCALTIVKNTKNAKQAILISMSGTLQLTSPGYSFSIIFPFSLVKPNLSKCVSIRHPSSQQWKQREREKEKKMRWGPVKRGGKKSKEGAYAEERA